MTDLFSPATRTVVEIAARKGVSLDIQLLARPSRTTQQAAETLGANVGQIVRSCVFVAPRPQGRFVSIVCLVAGTNEVDLDLLASVTGEVGIRCPDQSELRELGGHSTVGTSPFAYGRGVRVFMDRDLCTSQWIWAFAGIDTAVFRVSPLTLRMLANATVAPITAKPAAFAAAPLWGPTAQMRTAAEAPPSRHRSPPRMARRSGSSTQSIS